MKNFEGYTNQFASTAALAANTAQEVFSAVANVRGAIVRHASLNSGFGNAVVYIGPVLIAKATAPTNVADGAVIMGSHCSRLFTGSQYLTSYSASEKLDIYIPPGVGLYFISKDAEVAASGTRSVLYEML